MKLIDPHLAELRASGLTDATIEAAGIYTETNASKLAALLDWSKVPQKMAPAIVYPFKRADGANGYCRIKPDRPRKLAGKAVKYESPKGRPNEIYLPPGVAEVLDNPASDLLLTEGEKKSLAATQFGFPCVGLVGVWGWKESRAERLIAALARIPMKGRKVFIAFDSDMEEKPEVQEAAARFAYHLQQRGAAVLCLKIPAGEPVDDGKPTKQGIDDFLVRHGQNGLFDLLAHAVDPPEVSAVEMKLAASELDPASEVSAYLKTLERDGVSRMRSWRGTFWVHRRGCYHEQPTGDVRADMVNHLNPSYSKLTTSIVANCLQQLQAQTILSSHVEAPSWLGDAEPPFPAAETLACKNGLLHLPGYLESQEGHFRAHTPRFFSTCGLDFDFNPDAPAPDHWQRFLDELWPDDSDSIEALRQWFGYCLLQDTSQHKILLLAGPPRGGKGTIARIQRRLVGERNVAAPTLASLGTNFGLQSLLGKSLAIISDARLGGRADIAATTERLLSISGEDAITVDRKNLEPVTCKLPTRFVILTNELPRLTDASGALANRMIILRLTQSFLGREDHGLFDRLCGELPGILLWAITGWNRLRLRGRFEEPQAAADMRAEFNDLTSPVGAFVRDECEVGPAFIVARAELYDAYKTWGEKMGRSHVEDAAGFGRSLRAVLPQLGTIKKRINGDEARCYQGVGLKP